jgi:hypothetical protein
MQADYQRAGKYDGLKIIPRTMRQNIEISG